MTAYLDSSVALRVVLQQPGALQEWPSIDRAVSSLLIAAECRRTVDRYRVRRAQPAKRLGQILLDLRTLLASLELYPVAQEILNAAGEPMSIPLGTPGAIHLCTARLLQAQAYPDLVFATHDRELGLAAEVAGLPVIGLETR